MPDEQRINKMISQGRIYRAFSNFRAAEPMPEGGMWVEGYACRFNEPAVLWEHDGDVYREKVDPGAFGMADMTDIIFNYDHEGKVMARTRNKTLVCSIDDQGLFVRARLDGTAEGRQMYDEIRGGYIDKMSYCYQPDERGVDFDGQNNIWTVKRIKRVFDVSAVSFPVYETTSIQARTAEAAAIQADRELYQRQQQRRRIYILSQI